MGDSCFFRRNAETPIFKLPLTLHAGVWYLVCTWRGNGFWHVAPSYSHWANIKTKIRPEHPSPGLGAEGGLLMGVYDMGVYEPHRYSAVFAAGSLSTPCKHPPRRARRSLDPLLELQSSFCNHLSPLLPIRTVPLLMYMPTSAQGAAVEGDRRYIMAIGPLGRSDLHAAHIPRATSLVCGIADRGTFMK